MKKTAIYYVKIALVSICVTMAFCMDYQYVPKASEYSNAIEEILLNLYQSMSYKIVLESILTVAIAYFLIKMDNLSIESPLIIRFFACLLAICWVLHLSYSMCNSISLLYCTVGQIIKTVIVFVGFTIAIEKLSCLFNKACSDNYKEDNGLKFFEEHCYLKIAIILSILWLPHIVIAYPGNMVDDTWNQVAMAFQCQGYPRTTHHPAVMTMLLYEFIAFGRNVLNDANIGLFLYEVAQVLYAIFAFSYVIKVMIKDFHAAKWLVIITFTVMAFSPYFCNSVTIIVKDVPYAISYMLLTTELALFLDAQERLKDKKHILITALSILCVYVFRNNGVYALILIIVCFGIVLAKKRKFKYVTVFIIPVVLSGLLVFSVVQIEGFSNGSKVEAMCLPMQQVGRIVKFFPEDVNKEQKEILENVCDYEKMATSYNALIADPVKETFYKWKTNEEYLEFFQVWLQLAAKHPATAISATLAQDLPLISPFIENEGIYLGTTNFSNKAEEVYSFVANGLKIEEDGALLTAKNNLTAWYRLMTRMPLISAFSQQSTYSILLMIMTCYAIYKRKQKFLIITIPAWVGMLMIIAGPCIQYNPRYAYPIIYQIPMLIAYYSYTKQTERNI